MATKSGVRGVRLRRALALTLPLLMTGGLLVAAPSAASAHDDPIDGARTSGDPMFPNVGNGGYDALHYDVDLAWTPNATQSGSTIAGTIVASSTMKAKAIEPLKSFSLDFEGLEIDSVTVNGVPAVWERDVDPAAIKYKLIVTPAEPVTGEFTTVVTYHGTPSSHTDADGSSEGWNRTTDGATFLGQPIGSMTGYPHNNTPADKATYTFTLDIPTILNTVAGTAPAPSAAVSNGELASKTPSEDGSRTTWEWVQTKPMASELALISIGRYDVIESPVTLTDGTIIPSWSFMDFALSSANKTTITNRVGQLGTIIRNLETMYGPYPGKSTGVVVDTVPSSINYALETQDRSFFPSTSSVAGNTLIHELVHQWYGNNVAPTTWTDIWIGEGMATWGPTHYNTTAGFGTSATPSETTYFNSWNATAATSASWRTAPGGQVNSANLYGYQTYTRGAQFWGALKVAIGDTSFFTLIKEWQTRYAGTSKTGADLKALAEEISGRDLTAFYQDWILDADKPAWPEKLSVALAPVTSEATVARGETVNYTLTATNTGRVALATSVVTVDVSGLLDDGTIDASALPAGLTLDGTTLSWAVPATAVSGTASATFALIVSDAASGTTLDAKARVATLGGTCATCESSLEIATYDVDSAAPVITGDAVFGSTLTALTDGWAAGTAFSYAWAIDGTPVDEATADTFVVPLAAVGKTITVTVTGAKEHFSPVTLESAATQEIVTAPFVDAATPTISGSTVFGETLTAAPGTWDDGTALTFQWLRDGDEITGATGESHELGLDDIGAAITVEVTGTKTGFTTTTRASEATAPVAPAAIALTPTPTISGSTVFGKTLTAAPGTWDADTALAYQWLRDGSAVSGATSATYTLGLADLGARLSVEVTGTKPGHTAVVKTSAVTATVATAALSSSASVKITGSAVYGKKLTAAVSGWDAGTFLTFRWLRNGVAISGATGASYTLTTKDIGARISYVVAAVKPGFTTLIKSSTATAKVAALAFPSAASVKVTGTVQAGKKLTAALSGWPSGSKKVTYAWYVGGKKVSSAATLTLNNSHVGKTVYVKATVSATNYTSKTVTSKTTAKVRKR